MTREDLERPMTDQPSGPFTTKEFEGYASLSEPHQRATAAVLANAPFLCTDGKMHEAVSDDMGYWCDKCGCTLQMMPMKVDEG